VGARAVAALTAAAVAGAIAAGCAGPAPAIERVEVVEPRLPGHVRVELVVANRSGGHGQVQLEISLWAGPGRTLTDERPLELDGHQRLELTFDIAAPDADYVATARAIYPD
jgi:hypothetical protein